MGRKSKAAIRLLPISILYSLFILGGLSYIVVESLGYIKKSRL